MTMVIYQSSILNEFHGFESGDERGLINQMISTHSPNGVNEDADLIINLYVALKTKPMAILTGQNELANMALVQTFANILTEGNLFQFQMMTGHAWWAERSGNVSFFTEAQKRLNSYKIFGLILEALQPVNASRVFIAYLSRISPAELLGFFSEVAFQLQHGQLMRLPGIHLNNPIPFPQNLFFVGTMNTDHFDWWDEDLLSGTTVMQGLTDPREPSVASDQISTMVSAGRQFLQVRVRSERAARRKLQRILGSGLQAMKPLFQLRSLLVKFDQCSESVWRESLIFLANAWSEKGEGLFHHASSPNLMKALDLVIAQSFLPRLVMPIKHSKDLRNQLGERFSNCFPNSLHLLENIAMV